ncbi:MAG: flippase [Bacteroides ovatus]|jgi:O-antigen/teichoic acid export membrane protein
MNLLNNISENKRKVLTNVFWALSGKIINMGGALLVAILVARYLGPEQYGLMNYVISYVAIFNILSEFGMSNIEIRELAAHPQNKEKILGTCFILRLISASITYLVIVITLIIFHTDWYTSVMILVYGLSLFPNVFLLIRNYFTSIVENEYIVKSEIIRTFIGVLIKVILVLSHCSLTWFIIATAFDFFLVASGYLFSYRKIIGSPFVWVFDKSLVTYILKESFPLVLSGAAVVIYQRIDQVMIGNMIDQKSVAYFATAGKFTDLVLFLPTMLTQTVVPLLVAAKISSTNERYERLKRQFISIIVWISVFISFFLSIISYYLVAFTYGDQYLPAVPVLQILAFKTIGMALSSSSGQIIIMEHIQKWAVIRNVIACCVCVSLNYILIPKYGIIGSAWVTIITVFIASYFANIFIPSYHPIMKMQTYAIFMGWRELKYVKTFINSTK